MLIASKRRIIVKGQAARARKEGGVNLMAEVANLVRACDR